jgi:diguanylate cyclase (GGDEF)-like protein/PAS domain S-box-containing protein
MQRLNLLPKYLIVAVTLSVVLVAVTAFTLFTIYYNSLSQVVTTSLVSNNSVIGENISQQSITVSQRLAAQITPAMVHDDRGEIDDLIANARILNGSLVIRISDAAGNTIALNGDKAEITSEKLPAEGTSIHGQFLTVRVPVIENTKTIGYVTEVFDIGAVVQAAENLDTKLSLIRSNFETDSFVFGLAIVLIAIFITSMFAMAFAYKQVYAIRMLASSARGVAMGDYGSDLSIDRGDELGQLGDAFNQMRDQLRNTTVSRDFLDRVLSSMSDSIIVTSETGEIIRINEAASHLLGYAEKDILSRSVNTFVAPEHQNQFIFTGVQHRPMETVLVTSAGEHVPVSFSSSEIESDDPNPHQFIIVARNITDRKIAERRIRYLARIDSLTKVPNRMQFQHLLQRSIARARRENRHLALLYVDIDRFKDINDTFGHSAGDACLESLADRVSKLIPDKAIFGRLAGDEFGIAIDNSKPPEEQKIFIQSIAHQLTTELAEVLIIQGQEIYMSVSIGIASYPDDAGNVLDLIRNADAALYHAKHNGGNRLEFYDPKMNAKAVERLMLKSKLRRSYELDELLMNYQPKIDLKTGRVVGAEALVRWELSEHGLVLPSEFIPLAEETNLILEIGEWVLNRVCEDYRQWQRKITRPGRISVNLSLKQLGQRKFSKRVNRIFRRHNLAPSALELEITESTLMQDVERTIRILDELHDMGLHLTIDDFGTGYSSLSALQQFPISTLKIDKSFVRHAGTDADDATIVSTIIDMAHNLNMEVVAEGVESEEQLDFLKTLDCDYVQGLLFGKPMTADDYLELVLTQHSGESSYRALFA